MSCDSNESASGDYRDITWGRVWETDGPNHEGGTYASYITADDENDTHNYDEIPAGGSNRWRHQLYFTEKPKAQEDCDYYCYKLSPNFADIYVDLEYEGQQNIYTTEHEEPRSGSGPHSYGIGIGIGFGPVSAGLSASENPGPIDFSRTYYDSASWRIETDSFPTCQEETIGVKYDIDVQDNRGSYTFKTEDYFSYDVMYKRSWFGIWNTAYTETPGLTLYPSFEIV